MKRKVTNPYLNLAGHLCFGCSPKNPIGLSLNFWYDEENQMVETQWLPNDFYQGYVGVLHGGIQSTLMDEVASWCVYILAETAGVTSKMEITYRKPAQISKGKITVTGKLVTVEKRLATIHTQLFDANEVLCSEGVIQYFTYPQAKAMKELYYPGPSAF